jgi:hypothetical protein
VISPPPTKVEPQHLSDTRVQRNEPREDAQQRRLPGAVSPREQDDFSCLDIEVDTGQGREPVEEAHGRSETDDGLHSASGKEVSGVYGRLLLTVEPRPRW